MCYETEKAEFETARNEAVDSYFAARPQIFRTSEKECYVEAGFRMAWDYLKTQETVKTFNGGGDPFYCVFSGKEINEVLADIGREVAAELKDSSV